MSEVSTAQAIHLRSDMTVSAAMRRVAAESLHQLQENVSGVVHGADIFGDMECVHQARVALRRLRSADKAFTGVCTSRDWQVLLQEAQWLAGLLGTCRDWQILTIATLDPIAQANSDSIDFAPLRAELSRHSERAHTKLLAALRSKRYRALLRGLQQWVDNEHADEPMHLQKFACKALSKRWRKVDELVTRWDELDQTQRHTLRKRVKKLRYAIDFFSSLFASKQVKNYLKQLKQLQTALGDLNDTAVAQSLLRPLLRRTETTSAASAALGWLSCANQTQISAAAIAISDWHGYRAFW